MKLISILLNSELPAKSHAATSPELCLGVTAFEVGSEKIGKKSEKGKCNRVIHRHSSVAWNSSNHR